MLLIQRFVLAWLLVVAIPLQGFAASSMQTCAARHQAGMELTTVTAPANAHHHGSAHTADHAPAMDPLLTADTPNGIHHTQSNDGTCKLCSLCGLGTALPTSKPVPCAVTPLGSSPIAFTPDPFVSHIPWGSDPPPRSLDS